MERRTLSYVTGACGGELCQGLADAAVERVCTDSRRAEAGDLFIALVGDRFDGHDFVREVSEKGVCAVMVERRCWPIEGVNCAVILVEETRQALGRLASRYRAGFNLPVVTVGGSNGKTTTKELLASVLGQKLSVLWSEASFNNDVGVPLTLLNLRRTHGVAVVEVGTNHPGELAPLMRVVQPQFGVLTNIGREHLEFFGDLGGVAEEEGWLAELLPLHGKLFLNGDNPWAAKIERRTRATIVRVGLGKENDWRADAVHCSEKGVSFRVTAPERRFSGEYRVNLMGRHQVMNALLAMAVAEEMGVSPAEVRQGLAACRGARMRLELREVHGVRILDDTYNANEDSVRVALEALKELPCRGRRVAVLGDMAELGAHSSEAHAAIGRQAAETAVNRLIAVGKWAGTVAGAARGAGLEDTFEFEDVAGAVKELSGLVEPGDVVLLKASRATGFERLGALLGGA